MGFVNTVSPNSLPCRCSPPRAGVDAEGHPRGSRCRGDELPAERARAPGNRRGATQGCAQHRAARGGGKAAFGAQGPSSESIQSHRYFCHPPVSVPLCKAAFPAAKHPFLPLLQAPTLTASLSELPKNRLPPEDGAHIPLNRGQALHSTVHFGATPRRNPATLYQNHQRKTHS